MFSSEFEKVAFVGRVVGAGRRMLSSAGKMFSRAPKRVQPTGQLALPAPAPKLPRPNAANNGKFNIPAKTQTPPVQPAPTKAKPVKAQVVDGQSGAAQNAKPVGGKAQQQAAPNLPTTPGQQAAPPQAQDVKKPGFLRRNALPIGAGATGLAAGYMMGGGSGQPQQQQQRPY